MAAVPIGYILAVIVDPWAVLAGSLVVFAVGTWASHKMIQSIDDPSETQDQPSIVVDEVAGQLLALSVAGASPILFILGFLFFRAFDIVKPWPINLVERRTPGAWGLMLDDMVAGLFAAILVLFAAYLLQTYV